MKEMTLKDIQSVSLDVLKEFHRFCVENNLKYSLAYGTLIGAVRHKGFIPWDDDVDILMPRPDYNRFVSLYKDNENYNLFADEKKNCYLAYGRLAEMKRTLVDTPTIWANKKTGIWIDIMVLDGVEDDRNSFLSTVDVATKYWKNLFRGRFALSEFSSRRSFLSTLALLRAKLFYNSLYKNLYKQLAICHKYEYDKCSHISNMTHFLYTSRSYFSKDIFKDVMKMPFEDSEFYVMNGYDTFLTEIYGDYMQQPPVEQRVVSHSIHSYYWK